MWQAAVDELLWKDYDCMMQCWRKGAYWQKNVQKKHLTVLHKSYRSIIFLQLISIFHFHLNLINPEKVCLFAFFFLRLCLSAACFIFMHLSEVKESALCSKARLNYKDATPHKINRPFADIIKLSAELCDNTCVLLTECRSKVLKQQ